MNFFNKEFSDRILSINRYFKSGIAILTDIFFSLFSLWLAFYLRLEEFILLKDIGLIVILITILLPISIFWLTGLYRTLFRNAGIDILSTLAFSIFVYGFIYFSVISLYGIKDIPRSIGVIQPLLLFVLLIIERFMIKYLLTGSFNKYDKNKNKNNILIYGAGDAGRQLCVS